MVDMKEQMSLENYKKKVEDYLQLSVNKKESMRLMKIYVKELNEFCSEKLNTNRVNIKVTNLDAEHFTTFGDIANILDGYFLIRVHYFLYKGG